MAIFNKKLSIINYQFLITLIACLFFTLFLNAQYHLKINYINKDTLFNPLSLKLTNNFANQKLCAQYLNALPNLLLTKGYVASSVDSIRYDSTFAEIELYVGQQFRLTNLKINEADKKILYSIGYINKPINLSQVSILQQNILNYLENNGYPFATVLIDSPSFDGNKATAKLVIDKGVLYHVDSIRIYGKAKIANYFLQQYLGITNNSLYNKKKIQQIGDKLLNLTFLQELQPADVTLLGGGSIINVYLQPKKSSQVNFLLGLLPSDNQTTKLRLTGDVNLNLKNTLAHGENILLNWQQLQAQSPRLNIGYQQPYLFNSPWGVDFTFDLFKKDSNFLQLNALLGMQYLVSANQTGKLFFQKQSSTLLGSGVDTFSVKATKKLPANVDFSAVNIGVDYDYNSTNYRLNPAKGNEVKCYVSIGIKTIKKNSNIINIVDSSFNYNMLYDSIKLKSYQIKLKLLANHYFKLKKLSVLKTSASLGYYNSPSVFRNDLFQLGGYKLLRGFDEESIYANQYAVTTVEYRYLLGLNSYLFSFVDAAYTKMQYQQVNAKNTFLSFGGGMAFETKLGLLNISIALGKRSDYTTNLRQAAKIHFGYINYF